ncbi:hypothetical protein EJB05_03254, partial [Eragrostis curvula]
MYIPLPAGLLPHSVLILLHVTARRLLPRPKTAAGPPPRDTPAGLPPPTARPTATASAPPAALAAASRMYLPRLALLVPHPVSPSPRDDGGRPPSSSPSTRRRACLLPRPKTAAGPPNATRQQVSLPPPRDKQ